MVEGKSLEEAVDQGHWLASLSIRELGPQYVSLKLHDQSLNLPLLLTKQIPLPQEDLHSDSEPELARTVLFDQSIFFLLCFLDGIATGVQVSTPRSDSQRSTRWTHGIIQGTILYGTGR